MFLQYAIGLQKDLKKWVVECQNYQNEVRESLARLSSKMRIFEEQLPTAIDLLLQLTSRKVSPNAKMTHPTTNETSTQQYRDYIVHEIFGTDPDFDHFRDEGDYEDIQDYSQSNLVMPNYV